MVEELKARNVALHLLDLGGDISGNGLSKLFLTIAAAFAEAERDRIRERIGQVKADQKARGRYLGGKVPFGFRRGEDGELVPHEAEQEAIREMIALRAQGEALRAIANAMAAKGHRISHEGVAGVLRGLVAYRYQPSAALPPAAVWQDAIRNDPCGAGKALSGQRAMLSEQSQKLEVARHRAFSSRPHVRDSQKQAKIVEHER